MSNPKYTIRGVETSREKLFLFAGPCVLDNTDVAFRVAEQVKTVTEKLGIPYIFKASYAKANRTSKDGFRGLGLEKGLQTLEKIKKQFDLPVISDIHSEAEVEPAAEVLDVLQIPAFLCRQTLLLEAAGKTMKAINIKKGQFLAPWDMKYAVEKITNMGNHQIFLTERGSSFGYQNLVVDFRGLPIMSDLGGLVVFDGTHSVQLPGGGTGETAGNREMIPFLVRGAVAVGCDGLFLEVHPEPEKSPSDKASILPLDQLEKILRDALAIREALNK